VIPLSLTVVARAIGVEPQRSWSTVTVRRVTTDSRDVGPGDLFVAIRGPRFDGHDFVEQALAGGAVACLVERAAAAAAPQLVVEDTVAALGRLAFFYRSEALPIGTAVIAVTGSNGKTTTKCMIDHVLSGLFPGRASPKSFNNSIGVPLTLLSAEADDRYVVTEIGTSAPGEIASLAAMSSPNVGVITSIGEAHLEGLGDVHAVAAEKASLLRFVRFSGFALVNVDRPEILPHIAATGRCRIVTFGLDPSARLRVTRRRADLAGTTFELEGRYAVELPMPGPHHATNAAATFAVARWLGVPPHTIIERLRTFVPPEGRTNRFEVDGVNVVDDAYNANPSSVSAAIETLRAVQGHRRVLVLGDMLELGVNSEESHRRVIHEAFRAGIEVLVTVGAMTRDAVAMEGSRCNGTEVQTFAEAGAACTGLDELVEAGDTVWVKGSRRMELDRVVRHLRQGSGACKGPRPTTTACPVATVPAA
jgi:UDP-N-acetylmuramoyl-tripeptide--D-alanyl-D-alanine ligase